MSEAGRPTLVVDVDGVLADTQQLLCDAAWWATNGRVAIRPADVADFDWTNFDDPHGNRLTAAEWAEALRRFHAPRPREQGRLEDAPPIPGAVAAVEELSRRFDVAVATARHPDARAATVAWLARHLHRVPHTLHFVGGAGKQIIPAAAAVDDCHAQAAAFAALGVPCCLPGRPYNGPAAHRPDGPNIVRVADWAGIEAALTRVARDWHEGWRPAPGGFDFAAWWERNTGRPERPRRAAGVDLAGGPDRAAWAAFIREGDGRPTRAEFMALHFNEAPPADVDAAGAARAAEGGRPAFRRAVDGVYELHRLFRAGAGDSPEAEAVRDGMDGPWRSLTADERARLARLSEALYAIDEEVA